MCSNKLKIKYRTIHRSLNDRLYCQLSNHDKSGIFAFSIAKLKMDCCKNTFCSNLRALFDFTHTCSPVFLDMCRIVLYHVIRDRDQFRWGYRTCLSHTYCTVLNSKLTSSLWPYSSMEENTTNSEQVIIEASSGAALPEPKAP